MYLGLDLGTSGLKGLIINEAQERVAEATASLTVQRPAPGWSEQSPEAWIAAAEQVFDALKAEVDLSGLKGIGLSGQMHGAVLLGKDDQVLRPCILWNDTRAHAEAADMDANPVFHRLSGNTVFPGFTAPKIAWVQSQEAPIFDAIAKVLLPKDYLRFWLTGEHVSEMSDAAGTSWLDTGARQWSAELLSATGLPESAMPRLVEGSEVSATVRPQIAQRFGLGSVPVAGGGGDNAASAVGIGAVEPGRGFVSLGTSGVLFLANDAYRPDPSSAVHTFCHALPKQWHQMGVILSAADSLSWLSRITGTAPADLTRDLKELAAPGRTLFLPYLGGERTPHNDARVRGALLGLEHATDSETLTRAVLDGVAFAFRDSLDALTGTGSDITELVAVGGGAASETWLEAVATALDFEIAVPDAGDYGAALGAARLGLMAAEGVGAEIATGPTIARRIEPNPQLRGAYDDAQVRYREAYGAIKNQ